MKESDLPEVCEIEREIFSNPWSYDSFKRALEDELNIYLVCQKDDRIVGYCGLWRSFESADLCNMAVRADCRKRGYGRSLLEEGIRLLREENVEKVMLEVRQSNNSAIYLYEGMGFLNIGLRKDYYTNPKEDAIIMELSICKGENDIC